MLQLVVRNVGYKLLKPLVEKGDASYQVEAAAARAIGAIAAANFEDKPKAEKVLGSSVQGSAKLIVKNRRKPCSVRRGAN